MKIRLFTVPNMITLMNLVSGCVAVCYMLIHNDLKMGFMLICLAAVFDFFDGFVARLLGSYSAVGKELDSLADVVSFGVAPSAALFTLALNNGAGEMAAMAMFVVAGFSALRLAKFNIDENQKTTFVGLPTPAMAIFASSAAYLLVEQGVAVSLGAIATAAAVLCFLMVCNVEMFALKFSQYSIKGNEIRYGFVALSLVALVALGVMALPLIIATYVAISVVVWLTKKA